MTTNRNASFPDDDARPRKPMDRSEFESCVRDYVAATLGEAEQARFEESLLANPDWAGSLLAERRLREGLRDLANADPDAFNPAASPPPAPPA